MMETLVKKLLKNWLLNCVVCKSIFRIVPTAVVCFFGDLDFTEQNIICWWNDADYGNKCRIEKKIRSNLICYGCKR